ncbi:MAG: hypothetical protein ACOYJ1_13305 [Peptococcales bacterium]
MKITMWQAIIFSVATVGTVAPVDTKTRQRRVFSKSVFITRILVTARAQFVTAFIYN